MKWDCQPIQSKSRTASPRCQNFDCDRSAATVAGLRAHPVEVGAIEAANKAEALELWDIVDDKFGLEVVDLVRVDGQHVGAAGLRGAQTTIWWFSWCFFPTRCREEETNDNSKGPPHRLRKPEGALLAQDPECGQGSEESLSILAWDPRQADENGQDTAMASTAKVDSVCAAATSVLFG
jgi:hypothetical protein